VKSNNEVDSLTDVQVICNDKTSKITWKLGLLREIVVMTIIFRFLDMITLSDLLL
jgi:hypothetical protein